MSSDGEKRIVKRKKVNRKKEASKSPWGDPMLARKPGGLEFPREFAQLDAKKPGANSVKPGREKGKGERCLEENRGKGGYLRDFGKWTGPSPLNTTGVEYHKRPQKKGSAASGRKKEASVRKENKSQRSGTVHA